MNESEMPSSQKIALLLIALGQETSKSIFSLLEETEIEEISYWIHKITTVPQKLTERVVAEFYQRAFAAPPPAGGDAFLRDILPESMGPEKTKSLLQVLESHEERDRISEILYQADPSSLSQFLEEQSPKHTAFMLFQLNPKRAADLLLQMQEEKRNEIIAAFPELELFHKSENGSQQGLEDKIAHILKLFPLQDQQSALEKLAQTNVTLFGRLNRFLQMETVSEEIEDLTPKQNRP